MPNKSKTTEPMNSKHTPGPWSTYVSEWPNKIEVRKLEHDQIGSMEVAHLATVTSGPANARLIAAAPELLEALQGIVTLNDHLIPRNEIQRQTEPQWLKGARAAIAKATGQQ